MRRKQKNEKGDWNEIAEDGGSRRCGWRQTGGYTGRNCTAQLQHRHHGNEECHEELTEKSIE